MAVFSCFKSEDEVLVGGKKSILKRMWSGLKNRFSRKARKEQKAMKKLIAEAKKGKIENEKKEIEIAPLVLRDIKCRFVLDKDLFVPRFIRESNDKQRMERREIEDLEMILQDIKCILDEDIVMPKLMIEKKERDALKLYESVLEDVKFLFAQNGCVPSLIHESILEDLKFLFAQNDDELGFAPKTLDLVKFDSHAVEDPLDKQIAELEAQMQEQLLKSFQRSVAPNMYSQYKDEACMLFRQVDKAVDSLLDLESDDKLFAECDDILSKLPISRSNLLQDLDIFDDLF